MDKHAVWQLFEKPDKTDIEQLLLAAIMALSVEPGWSMCTPEQVYDRLKQGQNEFPLNLISEDVLDRMSATENSHWWVSETIDGEKYIGRPATAQEIDAYRAREAKRQEAAEQANAAHHEEQAQLEAEQVEAEVSSMGGNLPDGVAVLDHSSPQRSKPPVGRGVS